MNLQQFFVGRALSLLIILVIVILVFLHIKSNQPTIENVEPVVPEVIEEENPAPKADYKNATYIIEGERVTLKDGVANSTAAPGSASLETTAYFGNEMFTDLNGDNLEDIVFILTRETGGTGVFYYVAAALNTGNGYRGGEALLLGDRIAPQTIEKGTGKMVVVNYADRAPGESFVTPPSVGKSMWLILDPETMQFGEVAQDFEGEADPSVMSLTMKSWVWISTVTNDGIEVYPKNKGQFALTFTDDGRFSAKTDCNSMGGSYKTNGDTISLSEMMSTMMFCEDSQESEFSGFLTEVTDYNFTSKGELFFRLGQGGGTMVFR